MFLHLVYGFLCQAKSLTKLYLLIFVFTFIILRDIGTWNVKSMNQGKLEVVKQERERVNIDILGISELKWTGMGEFNSNDHYITTVGKNPLEEMEESSYSTKESEIQYLNAISKTTE